MKELSIEEKAKAYDNIIEKANKMHHENCEACQICIEELIPELAKSEDERVRKAIIKIISNYVDNSNTFKPKMLDWLENQGEQKSADIRTTGYWHVEDVEQKPAWSEEDREMTRFIGNAITTDESSDYLKQKNIEVIDAHVWLDSLKDRVLPQSVQEWSEEDSVMINKLLAVVDLYYNRSGNDLDKQSCISWLKSLRPQNRYAYNPYKATVDSISAMVEKYAPFDSNLQDFYDNVKVKCKDAKEYDSLYP